MIKLIVILLLLVATNKTRGQTAALKQYDIVVYGATSGGVIAAYTAKKMGKTVLLIEQGKYIGGLSAGGLGYTDIGNKYAITGLSRNFYRRIGNHYGKFEQWIFEPHVATETFKQYVSEAGLEILFQHHVVSVKKNKEAIESIVVEKSDAPGNKGHQIIKAKIYIDCSYEGDLMAKAGVSYFVGREDNSLYNETYNGVQLMDKHQFPNGVDPYKIVGDVTSGLLWGISNEPLQLQGTGDKKLQAYNFRLCLTKNPANQLPISKPANYDALKYELLLRVLEKKPATDLEGFLNINLMQNQKTDINNNGAFSTDMIGMNYNYAEAGYEERKQIQEVHEAYVKGLLYFIAYDGRMPAYLRTMMLQWGYPKDEYMTNGNFSPQMYVRETRRMKGAYVMTQANCQGKAIVTDGVGMAAYTMDSHNCQRLIVNGMVKNEGDVQVGGFGPYPVSYRSIIPKATECTNLLVPVCLSATHIAYGSIRMEPVFMVLAQSAATAAVMAINKKQTVQQVNVAQLQAMLRSNPLANNSVNEVLVDSDDTASVRVKGNWLRITKGCYGPSMFTDEGNAKTTKEITFIPAISQPGNYHLYAYFPKISNSSSNVTIYIKNGPVTREVIVNTGEIQVEGQTSGEWASLGTMHVNNKNMATVTITNKNANGVVVADAVLFVPELKPGK